jgi:hypothetical protein
MIWLLGLSESRHVTTDAFRRKPKPVELTHSSNLVARVAVHRSVGADQGESVLMFVDVVDRNLPAVGCVAEFTLRAILAAMQIGVAVLTLARDVREVQIGMAVTAAHDCVAAPQRKTRVHVSEFGLGPNRFPAACGVTILAGDFQVAMRTLRRAEWIRLLPSPHDDR